MSGVQCDLGTKWHCMQLSVKINTGAKTFQYSPDSRSRSARPIDCEETFHDNLNVATFANKR